ncbi:unnamed protein product, partial [Polarella glacialis]
MGRTRARPPSHVRKAIAEAIKNGEDPEAAAAAAADTGYASVGTEEGAARELRAAAEKQGGGGKGKEKGKGKDKGKAKGKDVYEKVEASGGRPYSY